MLSAGMAFAAPEQGLPAWKESETQAAGWVAGSELLANDPAKGEDGAPDEVVMEFVEPAAGDIPATQGGRCEVPEKFWPAYFAERPGTFLIDPQNLLSPAAKRERLGFLNYHASDSSIDFFVYVFGGDQEIPSEVRQEELAERLFSEGRPAAIVFYFMGAPDRSLLHLSPSLTGTVPLAERRRAMENPVMQAVAKADPSVQFETFLVQMSIRIYWIERLAGVGVEQAEATAVPAKARIKRERKSKLAELVLPHLERARRFTMPAAVAAGGLLLALAMRFWLKRRARFRFPDFEVEPRLGGSHAAGVGGVISFASATLPPASQRDQLPEYLRRA